MYTVKKNNAYHRLEVTVKGVGAPVVVLWHQATRYRRQNDPVWGIQNTASSDTSDIARLTFSDPFFFLSLFFSSSN